MKKTSSVPQKYNKAVVPEQGGRLTKIDVIKRMQAGIYMADPAQWVPDALGMELDEWQKNSLRLLFKGGKNRLAVAASHGTGKSMMSAVITHFFLFNFVPSRVIASGPTGKQTRSQYWSYINDMWNRSVFRDDIVWFKTKMSIKGAEEQWTALWLTSKEPRTIEGFHGPKEGRNLLWIIEEAKGVADPVFEAIQGALSHEDNYWYISSTCGGPRGFFYRCFYEKRGLWHTQRIPYTESTRISLDQVQKWKDMWGENSPIFRARAMAEFPDESDNVLVPLSFLERAVVPADDDYEDNARMIAQV
ncbi:MAG: hypothetical protein Q8R07_02475 [Candidatus Uhrbacteria bacterium]|nr:hypothetical protein [Candidatus Uhrbacteria bacterium]